MEPPGEAGEIRRGETLLALGMLGPVNTTKLSITIIGRNTSSFICETGKIIMSYRST